VEDNLSDAELTTKALQRHNLANRLAHVRDGAEALDFLFAQGAFAHRKTEKNPKVILLDLKMPKLNGMDVLKIIKADARTKHIPIVVLTSSKEDPDIKKCYELGVNSYVVKPVEFEPFIKAVSELGLYWMLINQSPH
jgi:two-component system, response regulator